MTRAGLPDFDGEHSRDWWRTIAFAHLQHHRHTPRRLLAARIAAQIRHRRNLALQSAICKGDLQPHNKPTGGTQT